jgi:hypothetical protein
MKKILFVLYIVIFSFLLSSCVKMNTVTTLDSNFNINEKVVIDYTQLNEMEKSSFNTST